MEFFINNVLYIVGFLSLLMFCFIFFKYNSSSDRQQEVRQDTSYDIEIKLRAYERLIIFLNRINLLNMINRLDLKSLSIEEVKFLLIKHIVTEYEYNISQQIYVSDKLWNMINLAKSKTINHVAQLIDDLPADNTLDDVVQEILKKSQSHNIMLKQIQQFLKNEIRKIS